MDAAILESLLPGIVALDASKFSWVASFTVMMYDYVLTFGDEVYIWREQRWSVGKVLYLVVCTLLTLKFSEKLNVKCFLVAFHGDLGDEVYAVYGRSKYILFIVGGTLVVGLTSSSAIIGKNLPIGASFPMGLTGCGITKIPPIFWYTWLFPMINETTLCILMLWKAWGMWKDEYQSTLLQRLVQDSAIYFLSIFILLTFNCLIWLLNIVDYVDFTVGWEVTISCTIGSRLLMNIMSRPTHSYDESLLPK
ncbi:hypothetical protein BU17DRAFT_70785 [Hysterangium stoloniferum]|nr:hypothetical protein BU17DRAFT_70785 [Hysterangium stoloniferum]